MRFSRIAAGVLYPRAIGWPQGSAPLRLRSEDLHWHAVEGEVLALDARTQLYLTINESGALLWDLLARGTTRAELVDRLVREYDLAPDRAASDVDLMVGDLSGRGLLADVGT
jgi:Coenzyme PQQ synthesis protein D (PqqD)